MLAATMYYHNKTKMPPPPCSCFSAVSVPFSSFKTITMLLLLLLILQQLSAAAVAGMATTKLGLSDVVTGHLRQMQQEQSTGELHPLRLVSVVGPREQAGGPPRSRHHLGQAAEVRRGGHGGQDGGPQQEGAPMVPPEVLPGRLRRGVPQLPLRPRQLHRSHPGEEVRGRQDVHERRGGCARHLRG
uniref:Uncharacterized protein n=1 Tax=Zea mays TaxID=4577 RepID=B6T870_MAIZE|nr:hypothetical protein [Zea mays]